MAKHVTDHHAGKAPAKSAAGDEQARMFGGENSIATSIFEAFKRSGTIPTEGRNGRKVKPSRSKPVYEDEVEDEVEDIEEADDQPMTLADLRRQQEGQKKKKKKKASRVDEDGGFDVRRRTRPTKKKRTSGAPSGASLAAGAIAAMAKNKS